ncbi:MAG TPA: hypothetical protein VH988_20755, partial [Thermoanaerobaculia bacterium]|nr:hypothetical protein [Thermoanaerobaculia bacterium]
MGKHKLGQIFCLTAFVWLALASALAADNIYWAGRDLHGAPNLDGTGAHSLWSNVYSADVAVDPGNNKVYWIDISTGMTRIRVGNLDGSGTPSTLVTTSGAYELQIDVANGRIYWDDINSLTIHWSSLTTPADHVLPLHPLDLRAIALDLRSSQQSLYYIDTFDVWRSDLNGGNLTHLPNTLGAGTVYSGMAIDTCNDQILVTGTEQNTPGGSTFILRADLADAGNAAYVLQDSSWTGAIVGTSPRKIEIDPHGGKMYWSDVGLSTIRRADLSGANFEEIANASVSSGSFMGLALDISDPSCSTVGTNKDLRNATRQAADGIEILLKGVYRHLVHYDGYPANHFASYTESAAPGGNTRLSWSSPNNVVQPGQIAHVGFNAPGTSATILGVFWRHGKTRTGCAPQVSTNTHAWGSPGSQVIFTNNGLECRSVPRYVGGLKIEWYAAAVPLADLNARAPRKPLRVDAIGRVPILLKPGAEVKIDV